MRQVAGICAILCCFISVQGATFDRSEWKKTYYETIILNNSYVKEVSPYDVTHISTYVTLSIPLMVLVSVVENEQMATWIAKVEMTWNDPRLAYDVNDIGITSATVPSNTVWIPAISVFNSIQVQFQDKETESNTVDIKPDGNVTIQIRAYFQTICQCDVSNFPFDIQECRIDFDTSNVAANQITINPVPTLNDSSPVLIGTPEWAFEKQTIRSEFYGDNANNYTIAYVGARLKRNSQFYILVLVIPTIFITACSLAALLLPLNMTGGEKINVALASFLGLLFMMSIVITQIPKSTTFPLLGQWLIFQLLLCFVALCVDPVLDLLFKYLAYKQRQRGIEKPTKRQNSDWKFKRDLTDGVFFSMFMIIDTVITAVMMCQSYPYKPPDALPII